MKKITLVLLTFVAIVSFSCNKDDSTNQEPVNEEPVSVQDLKDCSCYNGSVVLKTQDDIDNFMVNHPTCICGILANLTIGDAEIESDITSLEPLSNLKYISGRITVINNPNLTSLKGLNNINYGVEFFLENNDALTTLEGISVFNHPELDHPGVIYQIFNNESLQSLTGLEGLKRSSIVVDDCSSLTTTKGLDDLSYSKMFHVSNCPQLINLEYLSNLTTVEVSLIFDNDGIVNFEGLNSITEVYGVEIKNNNNLMSLSGLEGLPSQGIGYIELINNSQLESISGLSGVTSVGYIEIINNGSLTTLQGLQNITNINSSIEINENDQLLTLEGFPQGVSKVSSLSINNNISLTSIQQLSNLTTIESYYNFYYNNYTGGIGINGNTVLASFSGLENIDYFKGNIYITDNTSIADICPLKALFTHTNGVGYSYFYDNGQQDYTIQDVVNNCP